ncbi:hypothetical protein PAE2801 [Pyrobaculum aerophilum str. IM2]|uniref:Uncharacterized protein n=2 Tax=Pyrobaculum aerophilum TaxID=13773 RepID=Q8ZUF9_PYRAE|nr:hypothetical protein [Pyrobaculum aerophilum]AAL64448.1 hypothetical protein PAE2801 [Pyrobaculum aerophilum str. IM2]HII47304.1 hypothetical protein [Pyrobaculum aerophilum]
MDIATLLHLLAELLPFLPILREKPIYAYAHGRDLVICVDSPHYEFTIFYIDVEGYHIPPSATELRGSLALREGAIHISKQSRGAIIIKDAPSARAIRLVAAEGNYDLKIKKKGSCPHAVEEVPQKTPTAHIS